jgi:hypothetical protein
MGFIYQDQITVLEIGLNGGMEMEDMTFLEERMDWRKTFSLATIHTP